jgi:hypothetical protein
LSALLPALPGVSRIRLRPAPTGLLRQPSEEVLHLPRFPAPHGALRPRVAQQKISGRLASDDVTQDRLDISSYIDTARKPGKHAMDVLHDLMLGRPWRPPVQAFSP